MKIKHLLNRSVLALAVFSTIGLTAQNDKKIIPCATYEAMDEAFAKDPDAKIRYEAIQKILQTQYEEYEALKAAGKVTAPPVYTVPVVFHVLHKGGPENVSDAIINAALAEVNADYAKTAADASLTAEPFQTSFINSEIVFKLAKKDPNGNCTSGITRRVDDRTSWDRSGSNWSALYGGITWDPTRYLNIIVVKEILPNPTGGGIVVGYTWLPGTWSAGSINDCIVYRYDFLSGGNPPNSRSVSHEIGHWFNLPHTWGGTNQPGVSCGDDGVTDTPVTLGESSGCPSSSVTACTQTNVAMNGLNNVQNIMNYSSCPRNFTTGQTNRMRTALASATANRQNLWSPGNLTFTDVNGGAPCAPTCEFMSTSVAGYTACSGQSINSFRDFSYDAVTNWTWTATNGATLSAPNGSITSAYFPNPGTSVITLSVQNAQGIASKSRTVTVLNGIATATVGFYETFANPGTPTNWNVENRNTNSVTWAYTSNAGNDGSSSFLLNGSLSPANHIDILNMPIMDFQANPGASISFSYAYRQQTSTHADVFKVQLSDNCGASWKDVYAPSAAVLASGSGGVSTGNFVPTSTQWKYQDVSSHPNFFSFSNSSSVMGRFYFQEAPAGFGNKLYLDGIKFAEPPNGVNELTRYLKLQLYPNPTNGSATIKFTLSTEASVKVNIFDVTGKSVGTEKAFNLGLGEHEIKLNESNELSKGIYIVNIDYNGTKMAKKLIVE